MSDNARLAKSIKKYNKESTAMAEKEHDRIFNKVEDDDDDEDSSDSSIDEGSLGSGGEGGSNSDTDKAED